MASKIYIVPDIRTVTQAIKESDGITFLCPTNTVMTGRWHKGDENGLTLYQYSTLKAIDENGNLVQADIEVTSVQWSDFITESESSYQTSDNRVIVGRWHKGDEKGKTRYATAIVKANGKIAKTVSLEKSPSIVESSGTWFVTDADRVIIGRSHMGDENGLTYYISAKLQINLSSGDLAPEGTMLIPDIVTESSATKESSSDFICPSNTVIIGQFHSGDENGTTIYLYATLKAVDPYGNLIDDDGTITVEDIQWSTVDKDRFNAPVNRVIVGRKHFGDENAPTQYATAVVKYNGHPTYISDYGVSAPQKENTGWYICGSYQVITARQHYGDEGGWTYYGFGVISCQQKLMDNPLPFDLVVSLHINEAYYPMSPTDFATLSRFRMHIANGTDLGYDKSQGGFIQGNSNTANNYNVPLHIINGYYSTTQHKRLFNLRPRDAANLTKDGYFLQTFDDLYGDDNPNGRISVYTNKLDYVKVDGTHVTYVDFWLFFGYNQSGKIAGIELSHQGDWEHVMVELVDNKINGAWLSAHGPSSYKDAKDLNIINTDGREKLTIYCAKGTHALYNTYGAHSEPPVDDQTTQDGYKWVVTCKMESLDDQPWKLFAGAWGEVGQWTATTGPLGAWYKRFNFWFNSTMSLPSLIAPDEIIIVPDQYFLSTEHAENDGFVFEAPENMVLAGRKHSGDENGMTVCLYASLKAINGLGQKLEGHIEIKDIIWSEWQKESNSTFNAPAGYVILGRQHSGDENGNTRYKIGKIKFNQLDTSVVISNSMFEYQLYTESCGAFFMVEPYCLYVGRIHHGDENGVTENIQGLIKITNVGQ